MAEPPGHEPSRHEPPDVPLSELLGDAPLLREIQRVMLASTGPINWELARQIGIATASWGADDTVPSEEDGRGLADTVRAAELTAALSQSQGLAGGAGPAGWTPGFTGGPTSGEPGTEGQGAEMLQALMGQVVPLLMGAQVGT